jgi:hypothetical protein
MRTDIKYSVKFMTTINKLDKSFGPVGSTAGIAIFVAGIAASYQSMFGLVLVLIGAFVGFSSTSTLIDSDKRRIKFSNNLFGILRTGKWIAVTSGMKIGIKKSNVNWRAFSRGNRTIDIADSDFRVVLVDQDEHEIMPLLKSGSADKAIAELEKLCTLLNLKAIE